MMPTKENTVTDETRPVTRIRRPVMAQPKAPEKTPESSDERDDEAASEREAIQAEAREAEAAARAVRKEVPPAGAVREEIRREGHALPLSAGFEARAGDVLVVSYQEVTLPLPKAYSMMKFGGLIYTRQLREGDDVAAEAATISKWLTKTAETEGVAKYRRLVAEFVRDKGGSE